MSSSDKQPLSPARRWSRYVIWILFVAVMAVRYFNPPEPMPLPARPPAVAEREMAPEMNFGGPFEGGRRGGRMGRRSPPVPQPVTALPTNVWRIELEFAKNDAQKLREYMWNGWNRGEPAGERPEVPVTVREGGTVYTNVMAHLKGSAGSFRHFDDRPAITLNFSKKAKGQKFHGWTKISLNNSVQDSTYICELLAREMFVAAGVPAPRATHATVVVDGRDLGLYVVTEGWGKPFLKQHFSDVSGNLYDGGFVQDIDGNVSVASGDKPDDHSDLERLVAAAQEGDASVRWEALQKVLDVDRFITLLALDTLICNWDGYGINRNNYRVFHDKSTDRMVFMPHGLDQLFGGGGRMGPDSTIYPSMRGLVGRAVMTTPAGRKRYRERLPQLLTNILDEARLSARVQEVAGQIKPTLAAYGLASDHDAEVGYLLQRIHERIENVQQQLLAPKSTLEFGSDGTFLLDDWQLRGGQRGGGPVSFSQGEIDGNPTIEMLTENGPGSGSLRRRVTLGTGRYRFEARVRGRQTQGGRRRWAPAFRIPGRHAIGDGQHMDPAPVPL